MRLGVVKESRVDEKRVAITPHTLPKLTKLGVEVLLERGAGESAGFADDAYREAGASIVDAQEAWDAPVVVKVRPPSAEEASRLVEGASLISLIEPADNEAMLLAFAERGVNVVALEKIPRTTRAQKMDVLSSTANLAGYRAVLEAASVYEGFMGAQVTAAGTDPPARVLIIGAGVAGLAAIGAARALGAEVRAFDVRPATKEQVESLGAKFLTVDLEESGDGGGGYAKTMSQEFIEAEMALFKQQAKEVDIIITTALIPGKKAPILLPSDVVSALKPGSVVVDMAAERGGNCALTRPGEHHVEGAVHYLGYTDLPSRMASTASRFFSTNLLHFFSDFVKEGELQLDMNDEIARAATQVFGGERLEPPPPPASLVAKPKPAPPDTSQPKAGLSVKAPPDVAKRGPWGSALGLLLVFATILLVGRVAPDDFVQHFTVFVLACFVGWQVIWNVTHALHTPLMSVTNAISGIIIVGGLFQTAVGGVNLASLLGAVAVLVASINIFGGFVVTQRMLKMFRKGSS